MRWHRRLILRYVGGIRGGMRGLCLRGYCAGRDWRLGRGFMWGCRMGFGRLVRIWRLVGGGRGIVLRGLGGCLGRGEMGCRCVEMVNGKGEVRLVDCIVQSCYVIWRYVPARHKMFNIEICRQQGIVVHAPRSTALIDQYLKKTSVKLNRMLCRLASEAPQLTTLSSSLVRRGRNHDFERHISVRAHRRIRTKMLRWRRCQWRRTVAWRLPATLRACATGALRSVGTGI